jgi:hypothetical protein
VRFTRYVAKLLLDVLIVGFKLSILVVIVGSRSA